ncbi:hypothetical protein key_167 [Erwinia phage KEY]|uniref:Uncharacterized protein n=2 Tax=Keyvirus TaxID=3152642 RepID=A0A9Y0ZUA7_9CAUD|nr:hypothetical protein AAS21_gp198 [Pantoea phage vB_PagS_AAS21]QYC51658.1 hypothetical protein key_167 [Erwinia phage KEY]
MSQVIALNIVFSGTLTEVAKWVDLNNYSGVSIVIPFDSREEFERAGNRRDNFDFDDVRSGVSIFPIVGDYTYGFDISSEGTCYEIEVSASDDTCIYYLVDGLAGEAREPEAAEKVETIKPVPDVSKLTSDDLFTVVATYDDIHSAAKVELNNRISAVKTKLE